MGRSERYLQCSLGRWGRQGPFLTPLPSLFATGFHHFHPFVVSCSHSVSRLYHLDLSEFLYVFCVPYFLVFHRLYTFGSHSLHTSFSLITETQGVFTGHFHHESIRSRPRLSCHELYGSCSSDAHVGWIRDIPALQLITVRRNSMDNSTYSYASTTV